MFALTGAGPLDLPGTATCLIPEKSESVSSSKIPPDVDASVVNGLKGWAAGAAGCWAGCWAGRWAGRWATALGAAGVCAELFCAELALAAVLLPAAVAAGTRNCFPHLHLTVLPAAESGTCRTVAQPGHLIFMVRWACGERGHEQEKRRHGDEGIV